MKLPQRQFNRLKRHLGKGRTYLKYFFRIKRNQRRAIYAGLGVVCLILSVGLILSINNTVKANSTLYERQLKLQSLSKQLNDIKYQKALTEQQKASKEAELQKQIDELNQQLQSRRQSLVARASQVVAPTVYAAPSGCSNWHSGNYTIDTLINRESGGNTCATNSGGCYGILQACPGYPLRSTCGGDGACQLAWFTNNKLGSYGTWENALAHSYAYGWW